MRIVNKLTGKEHVVTKITSNGIQTEDGQTFNMFAITNGNVQIVDDENNDNDPLIHQFMEMMANIAKKQVKEDIDKIKEDPEKFKEFKSIAVKTICALITSSSTAEILSGGKARVSPNGLIETGFNYAKLIMEKFEELEDDGEGE